MFAKTIIDSDAFLTLPLSSQALYFHLSMRGDDEGFVNKPKSIMRTIGANEDDFRMLVTKNFIIPFQSGIIVIKHWKIHNYIRGDRIKETVYKEEKSLLSEEGNGSYTLLNKEYEPKELSSTEKQKLAYQNSCLPYSFDYKITQAFYGKPCPICGCKMKSDEFSRNRIPTIHHNMPISKGGEHELGNISVICRSCNTSIRDNPTEELNSADVIKVWDDICQSSGSQMADICQSSGSQMSAQDRSDQNSIDQNSIDKNNINILPDATSSTVPDEPIFISLSLISGKEYPITMSQVSQFQKLYTAVDVESELRKMQGWLLGNPKNRKTARGIMRFVTNWLSRAQDKAKPIASKSSNPFLDDLKEMGGF